MLLLILFPPQLAAQKPEPLVTYLRSFHQETIIRKSDRWLSHDKARHVIGSLYGTVLLGQMGMRLSKGSLSQTKSIAAGAVFTFGLAKEVYDSHKPNNHFCWKDMTANVFGIVVGIILVSIK
jgi:uncharacterized protein YfiM (DUF2279 family)